MGGGTTTGSLLNTRVFNHNSKSGVQSGSLVQARITLAGRSRVSGRTSYTTLSRSFNGYARPVIVGGGGCRNAQSMSTMEKIAMWNAIAQSSLQLGAGIASLVSAFKSDKPATTTTVTTDGTTTVTGKAKAGSTSLASTVTALSGGDGIISAMDSADGSKALFSAIQDAITYINDDLSPRLKDAHGKKLTAEQKLDEFKTKDSKGKTAIDRAKELRDETASQAAGLKENFEKIIKPAYVQAQRDVKDAENELGLLDNNYKTAMEARRGAQDGVVNAKQLMDDAELAWKNKKAEFEKLPADDPNRATMEAAVQQLKDTYDAKVREHDAAKKLLDEKVRAENDALGKLNLQDSKVDAAKKLLESRKATFTKAEGDYNRTKENLDAKDLAARNAQTAYDDLLQEKAGYEADIEAYDKLEKEYNQLSKLIESKKKLCTKMQKEEKDKLDDLYKQYKKAGGKADFQLTKVGDTSNLVTGEATVTGGQARHMNKATKKQDKQDELWAQMEELRDKSLAAPPAGYTEITPLPSATVTTAKKEEPAPAPVVTNENRSETGTSPLSFGFDFNAGLGAKAKETPAPTLMDAQEIGQKLLLAKQGTSESINGHNVLVLGFD